MRKLYCSGMIFLFFITITGCSFTEANSNSYKEKATVRLSTIEDLYRFLTYSEQRFPLISAHRGGPQKGYPENALETFQRSLSKQPLVIECDIALTKDSALVMMHDDYLDRTSTGHGLLADYTLQELKRLYLKDNDGKETSFRIPTLDEVLQWGRGKVIFTLDIKKGVPAEMVVDAVRKNDAAAYAVIITYNANQAAEIHRLAPNLMLSVSVRQIDDLVRLNDYGIPDNRLVAFVGVSEPDAALYEHLHEHGIMCIIGTMGNLDKRAATRGDDLYYKLIQNGADIISTDRVDEAGVQLLKYRKDKRISSTFIVK